MPLGQSDYTGDNKADLSLWHPATGELQIQNGKSVSLGKWGDTPVPGDYNGDGKVEFAVVQRTKGKSKWIFEDKVIRHGQFDDIPVPWIMTTTAKQISQFSAKIQVNGISKAKIRWLLVIPQIYPSQPTTMVTAGPNWQLIPP